MEISGDGRSANQQQKANGFQIEGILCSLSMACVFFT
jgi:hypothetical protein